MRRRDFLARAGAFSAAAGFGRPGFADPGASIWPQFRRDGPLTGVTPAALPATLKELWSFEAAEGVDSSAAIADGVV